MLMQEIQSILDSSGETGWVLEPNAKTLLQMAGLPVPRYGWAKNIEAAGSIAAEIGYPVAAKVVSPAVVHKTEVHGVSLGIDSQEELQEFYRKMSILPEFAGILVEEMVEGEELIVGATIDYQFGPTVLLGIGGTAVEVYRDVALRMAPLAPEDVSSMLQELKGGKLLAGYRGKEPINISALTDAILSFSDLLMDIAPFIESIDLNPLLCSAQGCVVADARIILADQ
jgi:acyl-CoA synthetase (NDP forming)